MFQIELDSEKLKDIVKKADKICGTLEPSNRKITFFAEGSSLYVFASDGCFSGYFEVSRYIFPKIFSPFEVPLDVVKQFIVELSGKIILIYQNGIVTFKCFNETLRLRVNYVSNEINLPKIPQFAITVPKSHFLNELDFVSCYLEEGQYVNAILNGKTVELIAHNFDMVSYSALKTNSISDAANAVNTVDTIDTKFEYIENSQTEKSGQLALSIPYVSVRHIIKTFDLEEAESFALYLDNFQKKIYIVGKNIYKVCGNDLEEDPIRIRTICKTFKQKLRINNSHLKKLLRRALIAGKFSDINLYTHLGELVAVSRYGSIAYKGSMEIEEIKEEVKFFIKTKAYLFRSALNRIGSQNILIDVTEDLVILTVPSLTRFLILKNNGMQ